jgi:branched-chain amino acid transport system permease protein
LAHAGSNVSELAPRTRAPHAPVRHWAASARTGGLLALAITIVALPLLLANNYFYEIAILVGLNAIVCVGLNLLIGYAGQISLGHAGFYALGGYGSAILSSRYGWPGVLSLLAATLAVGALAAVVGRPTLRLKGHYLAMATLGLGVIVSIVLTTEDKVTGGPDGMAVPPLALLGVALQGERMWYAVVGLVLLLAVWLALNLIHSPSGRALRALHGSETAAQVLGIDAARHKLRVFVISAVFAAFAGALTAHYAGFITPAKASFMHSIELVIMVVFGGMASVFGAVVGAAVLTTLPQLLTVLKDYEMMAFGAVLIATMIFFPQGIVPTLARRFAPRRSGRGGTR